MDPAVVGTPNDTGMARDIEARIAEIEGDLRRRDMVLRSLDDDVRAKARAELDYALGLEPGLSPDRRRALGLTVVNGIRLKRGMRRVGVAYCDVRSGGIEAVLTHNPDGPGWTVRLRHGNARAIFVQAGHLWQGLVDFFADAVWRERQWQASQARARASRRRA
jgi:hypothetical protein